MRNHFHGDESPDTLPFSWYTYQPGPVQEIRMEQEAPSLCLLRTDLIQSWASGNKYYKLKYVMADILRQGKTHVVSKGGMFSNHLSAFGEACTYFNLAFTAVIRSYRADDDNPSIRRLREIGAEIVYMQPPEYTSFDATLSNQIFPGSAFIPEGGMSRAGIQGAAEMVQEIMPWSPTHIVVAGGTLGTFSGIVSATSGEVTVVVVPAWKGCTKAYVHHLLTSNAIVPMCAWEVWPEHHEGGFGRFSDSLLSFIQQFEHQKGVPLDPVYTGKMMMALFSKIDEGYFSPGDRIMAIHTGGLQGCAGIEYMKNKRSST